MNYGLLNATKNDEIYTPEEAVIPILKYLDKKLKIVCPFDTEESNFYKILKHNGYDVTCYHEWNGYDFFSTNFDDYDIIISNPPYSIKDKVLKRLYEINKPFMMLLPLTALSSIKRWWLFSKYGIQLIIFDRRVNYTKGKNNWFASAYFCYKILPEMLIFERLPIKNLDKE